MNGVVKTDPFQIKYKLEDLEEQYNSFLIKYKKEAEVNTKLKAAYEHKLSQINEIYKKIELVSEVNTNNNSIKKEKNGTFEKSLNIQIDNINIEIEKANNELYNIKTSERYNLINEYLNINEIYRQEINKVDGIMRNKIREIKKQRDIENNNRIKKEEKDNKIIEKLKKEYEALVKKEKLLKKKIKLNQKENNYNYDQEDIDQEIQRSIKELQKYYNNINIDIEKYGINNKYNEYNELINNLKNITDDYGLTEQVEEQNKVNLFFYKKDELNNEIEEQLKAVSRLLYKRQDKSPLKKSKIKKTEVHHSKEEDNKVHKIITTESEIIKEMIENNTDNNNDKSLSANKENRKSISLKSNKSSSNENNKKSNSKSKESKYNNNNANELKENNDAKILESNDNKEVIINKRDTPILEEDKKVEEPKPVPQEDIDKLIKEVVFGFLLNIKFEELDKIFKTKKDNSEFSDYLITNKLLSNNMVILLNQISNNKNNTIYNCIEDNYSYFDTLQAIYNNYISKEVVIDEEKMKEFIDSNLLSLQNYLNIDGKTISNKSLKLFLNQTVKDIQFTIKILLFLNKKTTNFEEIPIIEIINDEEFDNAIDNFDDEDGDGFDDSFEE